MYGLTNSGLIPAHAGKTGRTPRRLRGPPAHPRSRGENNGPTRSGRTRAGSSPLTRGKRRCPMRPYTAARLIPAHAGKTLACETCVTCYGAHPRSRGENKRSSSVHLYVLGSSPLTRGKHVPNPTRRGDKRLIPAHAGKTVTASSRACQSAAHPRSRGENFRRFEAPRGPPGSSPLTRGKQTYQLPAVTIGRLIPAHAGKTTPTASPSLPPGAHPRSRGENARAGRPLRSAGGSSPLTRGKRHCLDDVVIDVGLIPAHAGKTLSPLYFSMIWRAHPRSRGENTDEELANGESGGSSPLTRGKPGQILQVEIRARLIPAHAGKTRVDR